MHASTTYRVRPDRGHPCRVSPCGHYPRLLVRAQATKAKGPQFRYVCSNCQAQELRQYGKCPECGALGTMQKEEVFSSSASPLAGGAGVSATQRAAAQAAQKIRLNQMIRRSSDDEYDAAAPSPALLMSGRSQGWGNDSKERMGNVPVSLKDLSKSGGGPVRNRMALTGRTGAEINRVLGGGVVCGSLVLVGGEPGVGKSTLSLQIAAMIAQPDLDYDQLAEPEEEEAARDSGSPPAGGWDPTSPAGPALATSSNRGPSPAGRSPGSDSGEDVPGGGVGKPKARRSSKAQQASASPDLAPVAKTGRGRAKAGPVDVVSPAEAARVRAASPSMVRPRLVLYVSGEETCEQVYDRAQRMGLHHCDTLHVLAACCMEDILEQVLLLRPAAVVVDSLQTMYLQQLTNVSGASVQLKECCNSLRRVAKDFDGITVFAIGHVTKTSDIAGPKTLEHMVDAVLRLEGDMSQQLRILRATKNRFGTTDEVGVFCMDAGGLHAVENPSSMFLANRSSGSSAVAAVLDGTRVLVQEVQALVTSVYPGSDANPVRQATGVQKDRLFAIIINVLHKFVTRMSNQNVAVNVTGGMQIREPGADLPIAVAIASSYYNIPVPADISTIGEIDLGGGLRPVRCLEIRLVELAKLGLKRVVIPKVPDLAKLQRDPRVSHLVLYPCSTLLEALRVVLGDRVGAKKQGGGRSVASRGGKTRAAVERDADQTYDDGDDDDEQYDD